MIIDNELFLSKGQAVTATAASTNVIDQGVKGDVYGNELYFVARVGTAFAAAGAGTLNVAIQTATDAAFTTPITLYTTAALALAALTANTEIVKLRTPKGLLRYVRAYYTIGTGPMTAGTIDAFFTPDVQTLDPQ